MINLVKTPTFTSRQTRWEDVLKRVLAPALSSFMENIVIVLLGHPVKENAVYHMIMTITICIGTEVGFDTLLVKPC